MASVEIELGEGSGSLLTPYLGRIAECFDVGIGLENGGVRPSRDEVGPRCDHSSSGEEGPVEGVPTRLKLSANSKDNLLQAKAFLETVTQSHAGPCERHLTLSPDQFSALLHIYHAVQEETQTIFLFNHSARTVSILGQPHYVNMAQSMATECLARSTSDGVQEASQIPSDSHGVLPCEPLPTQTLSPGRQRKGHTYRRLTSTLTVHMGVAVPAGGGQCSGGTEGEEETGRTHTLSLSPGAESAPDSCYDSDGSLPGSRRSSCTRSDSDLLHHEDVSRTVSDTLAAEHSETDTVTPASTLSSSGNGKPLLSRANALSLPFPPLPTSEPETQTFGSKSSPQATKRTSVDTDDNDSDDDISKEARDALVKQETQEFTLSLSPSWEAELSSGAGTLPTQSPGKTDPAAPVTAGLLALTLDAAAKDETQGKSSLAGQMEDEELQAVNSGLEEDEELKAVRFGIRLGYPQELVQRVLGQLGPDARKDDLLQELIRHTDVEKGEDEEEDENDEPVNCSWVKPLSETQMAPSMASEDEDAVDGRTQQVTMTRAPQADVQVAGSRDASNLRPIIIDGSNIAMSHGNKQVFSCRGIRLAVDYFRERGHEKVTVFVPSWRKEASRQDTQIVDQETLYELEKEKALVFTPSRWVSGKRIVCYDDLYIIKLAAEEDGIVVSNDNYRDLVNKSPEYKKVIEERLLMYSFVNDRFMPPDDPLGRHGPSLDNFLSKQPVLPEPLPPPCPYVKKCTYGNKCKYYHPERGSAPRKSVVEVLQEKEQAEIAKVRSNKSRESSPGDIGSRGKSPTPSERPPTKRALAKTRSLIPGPKSAPTKMALSRTQSLATGAIGNSSFGSSVTAPDSLNLAGNKSGLTVTRSLPDDTVGSCKVTVTTATPTDASEINRKSYDARLSKCRKEVEQAEAEQAERAKKEALKKNRLGSSCQNLESLHPPVTWSASYDSLRQIKPLRSTNSDPQEGHFETSCGHLSLAKKLSDEGKEEEIRRTRMVSSTSSSVSPNTSPVRQIGGPPEEDRGRNNGHRTLQRQLSLQGSEDPRLVNKQGKGSQKHKKEKRQLNNTMITFHGTSGPVHTTPPPWFNKDNKVHLGQMGMTYTFGDQAAAQHTHHQHHRQHPVVSLGQHEVHEHNRLTRHTSLGGENLRSDHHQNIRISPADRMPACRMASAPGTYSLQKNSQGQQRRSSTAMPTIHRQNSTSDPQLHIQQENNAIGMVDSRMLGMYNHHPRRHGFGSNGQEPGVNSMLWSHSQAFEGAGTTNISNASLFDAHLNLPGTIDSSLPHVGSFEGSISKHSTGSFDNNIPPSASYDDIGAGMMHMGKSRSFEGQLSSADMGQYPGNGGSLDFSQMHHFYQQQHQHHQLHENLSKHSPDHKPYGSDQSLFVAGRMQMSSPVENFCLQPAHHMAPRNSSPDIYAYLPQVSQPSPPQPSPPQQPPQQQDIFPGQMGHPLVNSISPVMMVNEGLLQSAPSPPHPEDQTPVGVPPTQNNPRHKLFYHLCGLFPEAKVREAMQRLPNETQPEKLFALIMTM